MWKCFSIISIFPRLQGKKKSLSIRCSIQLWLNPPPQCCLANESILGHFKSKLPITSAGFGARMLTVIYTWWRWLPISGFGNHHEKVFYGPQHEENPCHSCVAVGRLDWCPWTLKRLLLATAETLTHKTAQGSNRAAVQCCSQETVLCLERTRGVGATKSPAIATKKKKPQSAEGS